jgi:hypothetical protein
MSVDIFTSAFPLLLYLKVLGIYLPSPNISTQQRVFKIKFFDKIYFLVIFIALLSLAVYKFLKPHNNMSSSLILKLAWEASSNFGLVSALTMLVYQCKKSQAFVKILSHIHDIDEKVFFLFLTGFIVLNLQLF